MEVVATAESKGHMREDLPTNQDDLFVLGMEGKNSFSPPLTRPGDSVVLSMGILSVHANRSHLWWYGGSCNQMERSAEAMIDKGLHGGGERGRNRIIITNPSVQLQDELNIKENPRQSQSPHPNQSKYRANSVCFDKCKHPLGPFFAGNIPVSIKDRALSLTPIRERTVIIIHSNC